MALDMLGLKADTIGVSFFIAVTKSSEKDAVGAFVSSFQEALDFTNIIGSSFERVSLRAKASGFSRNTGRGVNHPRLRNRCVRVQLLDVSSDHRCTVIRGVVLWIDAKDMANLLVIFYIFRPKMLAHVTVMFLQFFKNTVTVAEARQSLSSADAMNN